MTCEKVVVKKDHRFYWKLTFFVKSTFLLKKLLNGWFHGNFWARSRFICSTFFIALWIGQTVRKIRNFTLHGNFFVKIAYFYLDRLDLICWFHGIFVTMNFWNFRNHQCIMFCGYLKEFGMKTFMIDKWSEQAFPVYDMQNFEFSKSVHVKLEKPKKNPERFERTKVFPHIFVTRNAIPLYAI